MLLGIEALNVNPADYGPVSVHIFFFSPVICFFFCYYR